MKLLKSSILILTILFCLFGFFFFFYTNKNTNTRSPASTTQNPATPQEKRKTLIMFGNQVYQIKTPTQYSRIADVDDKEAGFRNQKFYKDYVATLNSDLLKQQQPQFDMEKFENCVGQTLKREANESVRSRSSGYSPRSLQATTLICHNQQLRRDEGYVFKHGKEEEQLIVINDSPELEFAFLNIKDAYVAVPRNANEVQNYCLPPFSNLEACEKFRHGCADKDSPFCGYNTCKSVGANTVFFLDILLLNTGKAEQVLNHIAFSRGYSLQEREELRERLRENLLDYDRIKYCAPCPTGSRPDSYGKRCVDENGCDVFFTIYSQTQKRCLPKSCEKDIGGRNIEFSCSNTCQSRCFKNIQLLSRKTIFTGMINAFVNSENQLASNTPPYSMNVISQVASKRIPNFNHDFDLIADRLLKRYEAESKLCSTNDSHSCSGATKEFDAYFRKHKNLICEGLDKSTVPDIKIFCGFADIECIECNKKLLISETYYISDFLRVVTPNCSEPDISIAYNVLYRNLMDYFSKNRDLCLENKPFDCSRLPEVTENDIIGFLRATGNPCVEGAKATPTRSSPGRR